MVGKGLVYAVVKLITRCSTSSLWNLNTVLKHIYEIDVLMVKNHTTYRETESDRQHVLPKLTNWSAENLAVPLTSALNQ